MYDKLDTEVPFLEKHVFFHKGNYGKKGESVESGSVDHLIHDFGKFAEIQIVDGKPVIGEIKSDQWGSITSGLGGVAVGYFPEGNGFKHIPHVRIKASPAKILQGHNVFGPECAKEGYIQMITMFKLAYPDLSKHLDWSKAEFRYLDSTYSSRMKNYFRNKVIQSFKFLAPKKSEVNDKYVEKGYLKMGVGSEYSSQKIYKKDQQLAGDLKDALRKGEQHKIEILSNKRLIDFTSDLLRFEATTGPRKLEALGIPCKVDEFFKFSDWFQEVHGYPVCQYLFNECFEKYFTQFENHKMKNVNDENVRLAIDAKYIKVKENGRVCKRRANAVWRTYQDIRLEGYDIVISRDNTSQFRNINSLIDCGLSKAFLKSLDPQKTECNVISILEIIKIDFSAQRPDWYVEPKAHLDCDSRMPKLRLVG